MTGSDDFQIKVSAYGATWFDALQLERTSGRVSVLAAMRLNPLAGDPGTVADGDLWYNCSTGTFRNRQHRVSIDLLSSAAATAAYGGLQANYLLTSDTTAQKLFNCSTVQLFNCSTVQLFNWSTNGALSLAPGTYRFTRSLLLTSAIDRVG